MTYPPEYHALLGRIRMRALAYAALCIVDLAWMVAWSAAFPY